MPVVECPTCKRRTEYSAQNRWRPFCSERCKLIDLGEWASEKHGIPCDAPTEDAAPSEPAQRPFKPDA